ncbi:MAG: DUF4058 family protein [Anaerolineae bacterium]|nr:DUF4058 family protein [Anaerolineae bacterium]
MMSGAHLDYAEILRRGPFPGCVDPWAEAGRYFHQLHGGIISEMLTRLNDRLIETPYSAGREISLQIVENKKPDLFVVSDHEPEVEPPSLPWDFRQAAEAVAALPMVDLISEEDALDAVYIYHEPTGEVVTVIEVVSPRNKADLADIEAYRVVRRRWMRNRVHIVEIDLTRSIKRLVDDPQIDAVCYHVAFHLFDQPARVSTIDCLEAIGRIAVPLRGEVIALDLGDAVSGAYRSAVLARHILRETDYAPDALPFPSLVTSEQRADLSARIASWRSELSRLREGSG